MTSDLQPIDPHSLDLWDVTIGEAEDAELKAWATLAMASPIKRKGQLSAEQLEDMIAIVGRIPMYTVLRRVMTRNGTLDSGALPSWQEQEHRRGR